MQKELNAALMRQVASAGTFLLPVLVEACDVPPLLGHRRFADFRESYEAGLGELLEVFGRNIKAAELAGKNLAHPWPDPYLISRGAVAAEAARRVGRTSGWITQLTRRYNERSAGAVPDRQAAAKPGPPPDVDAAVASELAAALRSQAPDGGLWTAPKVARWIEQRTGRSVHETTA